MKAGKSILTIGSVALDSLEIRGNNYPEILGGSATYFSLTAAMYAPIYLSAVVGDDFPEDYLKLLKARKINLDNFQNQTGHTFRWSGKYSEDLSTRETKFTKLGVFKNFNPEIANGDSFTGIVFLGNIQPELQLSVIEQIPNSEMIITDTMNLWIDLNPKLLWKVVENSDIFLLNDEEAEQLTGMNDLSEAADKLLSSGPECVIIKQGERGSIVSTAISKIHIPVYQDITAIDPTGAGDSFAGGFTGYLAEYGKENLIDGAIHGTAAASLTVSGVGVSELLNADRKTIDERFDVIKNKMEISAQ